MKKLIIAEVFAATCVLTAAAWSQATEPARQTIRYFTTSLENDPTRDLTPRGIATAVSRLEVAAVPLTGHVYVLNHWR